jgi:O-antigen ligase
VSFFDKTGGSLRVLAFNREDFVRLANILAVALAISLPWSTSATGILVVLWLLALIPTIDLPSLRRVLFVPAGGLPVLLVMLSAFGVLWANSPWAERFHGLESFLKLLCIPLFLYQFCRSDNGRQVLIGFVASCVLLLVVSWSLWAWPGMPWPRTLKTPGVPVKDHIAQSAMFAVCSLVLVQFAYDVWRDGRRRLALVTVALALVFLANVSYVATSRTYLVVIPALLVVFGYRQFGWKGAIVMVFGCLVLAATAWSSATSLRARVNSFFDEVRSYEPNANNTSAGERLVYWTKAVGFIQGAPLLGHGTGSIREQYRHSVANQIGMAAQLTDNPHNQTLAIGIQIGLVGMAVLLAMWIAHLELFRSNSFAAWVGLVVVTQNVIGSLFNSHLFDFTHGWAYVIGVGVAGGTVLRQSGAWPQREHSSIRRLSESKTSVDDAAEAAGRSRKVHTI